MSSTIGVNVTANFNSSAVTAGVNNVQQAVNQANRTPLNPVSPQAVSNATKLFEVLKRIRPELNRRANASGQSGVSYEDFDFERAGYSQHHINRIRRYVGDTSGAPTNPSPGPNPAPGSPRGGQEGSGFRSMAAGVVQAGLRAAGPAGGVASGALGTGMASGFGAGLMGLMGGMLALGVGKAVGAVTEKVSEAEDNAIAYDKLKRVLGDVSVSFRGLQAAVEGSAKMVGVTFDDAGKLSTQFSKSANLNGEDYKTLPEELKNGVGLSRSFGLDPSQGVGVMGRMRGIGVTKDLQDSRRFALLIGETIGKSRSFAKADEVMDAMASYAINQTRSSMGGANVQGYSGMLAGLVGSGIPGMDPSGAASLIGRVNSTLSLGGAKGEASQFFTNQVGSSMGLDPIQTQILREGGAFATKDNTFGEGSVYQKFMGDGAPIPTGKQTLLDGTLSKLRQQYGSNKGFLAQATANHLGVNMRQAMGLLSVKPEQMGEMETYAGDLTKMSGTGIGNLSKALYGSAADRQGLAKDYLGRTGANAISDEDRKAVESAKGDDSKLRDVLGRIASKYDQETTQGSDIRDSRIATQNIATKLASELIPLTQQIRHGVMYMAGGGKMSALEIQKEILKLDSKDNVARIGIEHDGKRRDAIGEADAILKQRADALADLKKNRANMTPEQIDAAQKRIVGLTDEYTRKSEEVRLRILELQKEKAKALEKETEELKKSIDALVKVNLAKVTDAVIDPETTGSISTAGGFARFDRAQEAGRNGGSGSTPTSDGVTLPKGMGPLARDPAYLAKVNAAEDEIGAPRGLLRAQQEQESRFHPNAVSSAGARGIGQIMPSTQRALEKRMGRTFDAFNPDDNLIMQKEVMRENYAKFKNWDDATSAYNGGWTKGTWGNKETSEYTPSIKNRMHRYEREGTATPKMPAPSSGTPIPMPPNGSVVNGWLPPEYRIKSDPITVEFVNPPRDMVMPSSSVIKTRVTPPVSFGAGR